MSGNGALTAVRTSLSEQIATLRGVAVAELPESLLAVAVREGAGVHLLLPADWEALRHDEDAAGRPVPFWARPWPSGRALAEALAADPPSAGARVLELGCGLAAPSIVAARAGAEVLATDGATDAVAYAAHSLALNQVLGEVAHADWAEHGEQLAERGPFDLILAADVLYTAANADAAVRLLPRLVAPEGEVRLAHPRRTNARRVLSAARASFVPRPRRGGGCGWPTPAARMPAGSSRRPARASCCARGGPATSRCTRFGRADAYRRRGTLGARAGRARSPWTRAGLEQLAQPGLVDHRHAE